MNLPSLPMNASSQTAAAHPAAELRGMQGAAARLIKILQIHLLISFSFFRGSLLRDVIPNYLCGYTLTNRTDISTIAPKLAAPKFFPNLGKRLVFADSILTPLFKETPIRF
jgi:hypothetical protein